jgi:hypothetical protein
MHLTRHFLIISALGCLAALSLRAGSLNGPYIEPAQFTSVPFGSHSHWQHPWRGHLETAPAQWFLESIGMVVGLPPANESPLILEHLARHGIKTLRTEVGWAKISTSGAITASTDERLVAFLQACQQRQLRPVILLNGNHGAPCPHTNVNRTVPLGAAIGDTQLTLSSTANLVEGRSGLNNIGGEYKMAAILFTATATKLPFPSHCPKPSP